MRRVRFGRKLVNAFLLRTCWLSAVILAFSACSESQDSPARRKEKTGIYVIARNAAGDDVSACRPSSRTIIGDGLSDVLWSEKDRISFYYRAQDSQEATASSELGVYRIYPDETVFTGEISFTPDTYYDCFAVYPKPESVSDNVAVFDLPAVQDGLYDSSADGASCDIMVAEAASGIIFSEGAEIPVNFHHKCHAFRIQVPSGRNLFGMDVKKLRVEFPTEVVGKLSVDMANPETEAILEEGGAKTVWLDLAKVLKESETGSADGIYAWLFTAPVTVSGEVRFTAYSEENYMSGTISVSLDKVLQEGQITPVTLTVPQEPEYASVMLKVGTNNLGEDYDTVTVTAPDGAVFRNGASSVTFARNGTQEYPIEFYGSVDGVDNLTPMKSGNLTVEFDSEHAIVAAEPISLADYQWGTAGLEFSRDVPYLLYEDFSGALSHDGNRSKDDDLSQYNLPGWSAYNYDISAGQSFRMRRYVGTSPGITDVYPGRLDSPFLSGLKDGTNVRLSVSFDIGGVSGSPTVGSTINPTYAFGVTTVAGATDEEIPTIIIPYESAGDGGSYTNLPMHKEMIFNAGNSDRLSWRAMSNEPTFCFGATAYVYIDNIKVQIAPEETE